MELKFQVTRQTLKRTDSETPVERSQGYLTASFAFSDDWAKADQKWAFFGGEGTSDYVAPIEDGECQVPHNAIKSEYIKVWLKGQSEDGTIVMTTNALIIPMGKTGKWDALAEEVNDIQSSTLSVRKKGSRVTIETLREYGISLDFDDETKVLSLIGEKGNVLESVRITDEGDDVIDVSVIEGKTLRITYRDGTEDNWGLVSKEDVDKAIKDYINTLGTAEGGSF